MKKNNILIFYVLAFLQGLVFYSSVCTLYRTDCGISLTQMGLIDGVLCICVILFEVPWGLICDRIGYHKTIVISNGFFFLSKLAFYKATTFWGFVIERVLLGIASSGLSGCDTALLYLSVPKEKAIGAFGRMSMFGTLGMCCASLSFSLFFSHDLRGAALWTAIMHFVSFVISFFLVDVKEEKKEQETKNSLLQTAGACKKMLPVLIASLLLTESMHTLTTYYNQLQYESVGIPVQWFGILFMIMNLVSLSTGLLDTITQRIQRDHFMMMLFVMAAVLSIGIIFTHSAILSVVIFACMVCAESMTYALMNDIQNESIDGTPRASTLSLYSLFQHLGMFFTGVSFGVAADHSLTASYGLSAVFCVVGLISYIFWYKNRSMLIKKEEKESNP